MFVSPHQSLLSSSLDLRPAATGLSMANSSLTALEVELFPLQGAHLHLAGGDEDAWIEHHQLGQGVVRHCHQNGQVSSFKGETIIGEVSKIGGRREHSKCSMSTIGLRSLVWKGQGCVEN